MSELYSDMGGATGARTRYFRNAEGGGVEWMFAADHAAGHRRWFHYGAVPIADVEALRRSGMRLFEIETTD